MKMNMIATVLFSAAALLLTAGFADARTSESDLEVKTSPTRIEQLNEDLEKAMRKKQSPRVLQLLVHLARHHFHPEKIPEFRRYTLLLASEASKHSLRKLSTEQQILSALGAIANSQASPRVNHATKAAVNKLCQLRKMERSAREYSLLDEANSATSEACWKLLTGDATSAAELEVLAYNFYVTALHDGQELPHYVTTLSNKPFIIKVIEGRFCSEAGIFCR